MVRRGEPHAVVDHDGHVYTGYDATEGTLMLIRPDGYIALATNDGIERVTEYWARLHGSPVPAR